MKPELLKKLEEANVLVPTACYGQPESSATVSNAYRLPDPKWEHDCDCCLFLGTFNNADLYFCPSDMGIPTVIARLSSEPSDYASGEMIGRTESYPTATHRELRVAWLIAKDCGLVKDEEE